MYFYFYFSEQRERARRRKKVRAKRLNRRASFFFQIFELRSRKKSPAFCFWVSRPFCRLFDCFGLSLRWFSNWAILLLFPECERTTASETSIAERRARAAAAAAAQQATRYADVLGKRYRVLQRVGKGSFGTVFKAVDIVNERLVALKRVESEDIEEIVEEIAIMEQVTDPHIVQYLGNFLADDYLWIAMEFGPYGSVADVMRLARLTFGEAGIATICRDVLAGLAYLHSSRKVHRDIKPHNMLFAENGVCKIADFGVSGQLNSFVEKRTTITGTPYYIAPEILAPDSRGSGYDAKADCWSLGISAIEMAQGQPPHYSIPPMKALLVIPSGPPPTLADPDNFSKEFNAFIAACLVKDPEKRPSSERLLLHPFITARAVSDPWTIHAAILQKVRGVIDAEGGMEAALRAARQEEKAREARALGLDAVREREEFLEHTLKIKKKSKIVGKLKRFLMRRPKKEELEGVLRSTGSRPPSRSSQPCAQQQQRAAAAAAASSSAHSSHAPQQPPPAPQPLPPPPTVPAADSRWMRAGVFGRLQQALATSGSSRPRTMFLGARASVMWGHRPPVPDPRPTALKLPPPPPLPPVGPPPPQQQQSMAVPTGEQPVDLGQQSPPRWHPSLHHFAPTTPPRAVGRPGRAPPSPVIGAASASGAGALPHWLDRHKRHGSDSLERSAEADPAATTFAPETPQGELSSTASLEDELGPLPQLTAADLDLSGYEQERPNPSMGILMPRVQIPPPPSPPPQDCCEEPRVRRRSYTSPQPLDLLPPSADAPCCDGVSTDPATPTTDIPPPLSLPPPPAAVAARRPLPRTPHSFQNITTAPNP